MDTAMSDQKPIRVAVIGGGCAAMSAAFEVTRPEHRGRYQVTIYQQGWRLGGKGASGRGPADRIEEHGLHLWMGWYENAFSLIRQCYGELDRDPRTCRLAEWTDAFKPAMFRSVARRWLAVLESFLSPRPGSPRRSSHRKSPLHAAPVHGAEPDPGARASRDPSGA